MHQPLPARGVWLDRATMRSFLALAVAPNLVMMAAAAALHGRRALVDLDYVALAALAPLLGTATLVALLGIVLLLDIAFTLAPTFNFGPREVLGVLAEIRNFGPRTLVFTAGVLACIVLVAVALARLRGARPQRLRASTALSGACVVVLLGVDALVGGARRIDVAESRLYEASRSATDPTLPPESGKPVRASTAVLRDAVLAARGRWRGPDKIVLVLVESMGLPTRTELSRLFAVLETDTLLRRYTVRTGTVPYFGGTTSAEFRGLCGVRMNHFTVPHGQLTSCLPAQLKALGFETVALHGYNGELFRRREWYPRLGFDRIRFQPELQAGGRLPECGVMFHGVCDSSMVQVLREELLRAPRQRQLIYWLTLSSHFPLDPRTPATGLACDRLGEAGKEPEVCTLANALDPVLAGLARIASDTTVPRAWYVIVGDHSPRLLRPHPGLFWSDRVPFIELRPKLN